MPVSSDETRIAGEPLVNSPTKRTRETICAMISLKSWCHKQYGQYIINCVMVACALTTAGRERGSVLKGSRDDTSHDCLSRDGNSSINLSYSVWGDKSQRYFPLSSSNLSLKLSTIFTNWLISIEYAILRIFNPVYSGCCGFGQSKILLYQLTRGNHVAGLSTYLHTVQSIRSAMWYRVANENGVHTTKLVRPTFKEIPPRTTVGEKLKDSLRRPRKPRRATPPH